MLSQLELPEGWRVDPRTPCPVPDPFLIVSFYTTNYRDLTEAWIQAAADQGHGHQALLIDTGSVADWRRGTFRKPTVIRSVLSMGYPVLWIDVDAILLQPIDELQHIDTDLGIHVQRQSPHGGCWWSGTMYWNANLRSLTVLGRWEELCSDAFDGDQEALGLAVRDTPDLTIHNLPLEYVYIPRFHPGMTNAKILHKQASRDRRRGVSRSGVTAWFPETQLTSSGVPTTRSTL